MLNVLPSLNKAISYYYYIIAQLVERHKDFFNPEKSLPSDMNFLG